MARTWAVLARALAAVCALLVAGAVVAGAARAAGSSQRPAVHATQSGSQLTIRLDGWPAGQPVSVTVCGGQAARGSLDCALSAGTLLTPDASGTARGTMRAAAPPAPCPCVVRARAVLGPASATTPAPADIVGSAAPRPDGVDAAPDPATVSVPATLPAPALTVGRYVALIGAAALVLVLVIVIAVAARRHRRRARPRSRTPRRDLLLLRLPALACALTAVTLLVALGYRAVDAGERMAAAQRHIAAELARDWSGSAPGGATAGTVRQSTLGRERPVGDGQPFGLLRVPAWGADYQVGLVQGVTQADLAKGPGHYPHSAMPGAVGNFALAGHRGPPGEPFNDIDALRRGDRLIVETARSVYVYRVTGHAIVSPHDIGVVAPVPRHPGRTATQAVMTLTACHPKWSSARRWVTWAVLVSSTPRT